MSPSNRVTFFTERNKQKSFRFSETNSIHRNGFSRSFRRKSFFSKFLGEIKQEKKRNRTILNQIFFFNRKWKSFFLFLQNLNERETDERYFHFQVSYFLSIGSDDQQFMGRKSETSVWESVRKELEREWERQRESERDTERVKETQREWKRHRERELRGE